MATKRKDIPQSWVNEKNTFLQEMLPKEIQQKIFYPDALFYTQYHQDPLKGLHFMAGVIFDFLKIQPNGCIIDFYDEKKFSNSSGDMAGFYTKIKNDSSGESEVIFINSKYKKDPLAVGAILAHEMMHLYLFRLNLKLADVQENELFTDLATINVGLSILILNGMSYSSQWHLSIILLVFGRIYWSSQEVSFGYFNPQEYGLHTVSYFNKINISAQDVIGYLNPTSRRFIPHPIFAKGKKSTFFIKALEKQHRRSNLIKGAIAAPFLVIILFALSNGSSAPAPNTYNTTNATGGRVLNGGYTCSQYDSGQADILDPDLNGSIINEIKLESNALDQRSTELDQEKATLATNSDLVNNENQSSIDEYNSEVDSYNSKLDQYKTDIATLNAKTDAYNAGELLHNNYLAQHCTKN